jgi:lipid A ethanolaminephosphotransferase
MNTIFNKIHPHNWQLSSTKFIFIVTFINLFTFHTPLLSYATANLDYASSNGFLTLFIVGLVIFLVTFLILSILSLIHSYLLKIFSLLIILTNSIALYFINTYHIALDTTMMGNILNTQSSESLSFLHPKMLLYFIAFGLIPAWLIYKIQIIKNNRFSLLKHTLITLIISLGLIFANGSRWLWVDKHASHLGGIILPWSYIINTARLISNQQANIQQQLLPPLSFADKDKTLVVLVIGESARAKNFSLYGYDRETNPLLKKSGSITLQNSHSCSTYTTASVHCILSSIGSSSDSLEPLPSYLSRHGVDVIWRTKNWGEPKIKVNSYTKARDLAPDCKGKYCDYDGIMLTGLKERICSSESDKKFIVLHMTGSHGPTYYKKYPSEFETFKPVCKSVELSNCTNQELINAYDNTVLYTDFFLNQVIELLKQQEAPALMIYISDHGESLGEYGLYLHGTPKTIAPDVQTVIPFILWMSEGFKSKHGITNNSFKQREKHTQKNIFHTVLGAFNTDSEIYMKDLDLLKEKSN